MIEDTAQRESRQVEPGVAPSPAPLAMCPMAAMCKGMMAKPPSRALLVLPGALLIFIGVLVLVEPRIVAWLVGTVSVLAGVALVMMGNFIRTFAGRIRDLSST